MSVANAYAKALFEAARDSVSAPGELDTIEAQMSEFSRLLDSSKDLRVALLAPVTPAKEKADIIQKLADKAGFAKLFVQFLVLMARKDRLSIFEGVRREFRNVRLDSEGGILGKLVSADPLNPADVDGLAKAFAQKLGKRVAFQTSTDPALLAGMKVTVNGVTYDGSLRAQLARLRDRLVQGQTVSH